MNQQLFPFINNNNQGQYNYINSNHNIYNKNNNNQCYQPNIQNNICQGHYNYNNNNPYNLNQNNNNLSYQPNIQNNINQGQNNYNGANYNNYSYNQNNNNQFCQPNIQKNIYQGQNNYNNSNYNNMNQNNNNQSYQPIMQNNYNNSNPNDMNNQNINGQNLGTKENKKSGKFIYDDEALIDKIKDEEDITIGFDLSLLRRKELQVNLIHFDLNISNGENYEYSNKFKVDVVGGYIAMNNTYMLKNYLEEIKNKNIPFIVLSSGYSGKDVIPICKKYPFIKEVIIFCGNYNKYQHYLTEYPEYVKKIFINIKNIYDYIQSFGSKYYQGTKEFKTSDHFIFSPEDIQMNRQLEQCPVISAYEYDNCYFLVHRAYGHFFRNDNKNVIFTQSYFNKIREYIIYSDVIKKEYKSNYIKQFKSLVDKQNLVELSIRLYTGENKFCYIFNRTIRNFDKGLISLAYYMGPLLYALNKYVKENQKLSFREDMTLYRNIVCSEFDFYLYRMNYHHIICFPSITSTSLSPKKFIITKEAKKINDHEGKSQNLFKILMIFNYKHEKDNISPGICILNNKGKDNLYLSEHPTEKEVMLFPFTFARITAIKEAPQGENEFRIYFDIINRKKNIEYILRNDVKNRVKFSELDKILNK